MADRMQFQAPSIFTSTTPQVRVDDGTGDFLRTQANVFLNNANESHKRQLQADLDYADREGQRVGYKAAEKFKPMRDGSLFSRAFNQSGLQQAGEQISIKSQRTVRDLSKKFPANPGGLKTALDGWREGFESELPEELQPVFGNNFDQISDAAVARAESERETINAQQAAADFYVFEREVTNTMEDLAPMAFATGPEGDKARLAIGTIRQNYMESLAGNGPAGEYEVGGYKVASAPGRSGAFTPLEIQKKMTAFDNMVIGAGVFGNFQKETEAGRGAEAYMQFAKGDMEITTIAEDGSLKSVKLKDVMTNDEMEEISGKMRTYIGGINSVEEGEYRKFERGRERYNDQVLNDAYRAGLEVVTDNNGNSRVIGGDPVALQNIIAQAAQNPLVQADTLDKLQKLASDLGTGQIDNPITVGRTWQGISTGEIASYRDIPELGINDKTRVQMYKAIDDRVKGQHWTTSKRYGIAQDYADAVLAPEKSAGFTMFGDPNAASVADRAEWNKRMIEEALAAEIKGLLPQDPNGMPGKTQNGEAEFDFVGRGKAIADEIAARRNKPASPEVQEIDTEIKTVEEQMNNPKKGDDVEAIKQRYRELQDRKNQLQTRQMMGVQ